MLCKNSDMDTSHEEWNQFVKILENSRVQPPQILFI